MENTGSASVLIRIATSAGEHRKKSVPLFGKGRARKEKGVRWRARAVLILAMAKTNMARGRKKYGNIAVEKVFGELAFGDQEMVIYARTRYLFPLSLSLSFSLQTVDRVPLRQNVEEERSSLENVQRRGKLNLFGRLSGMDSSGSRLMRFSDYSREE